MKMWAAVKKEILKREKVSACMARRLRRLGKTKADYIYDFSLEARGHREA